MSGETARPQMFLNGVRVRLGPDEEAARTRLEARVRADYERANPGDSFDALKRRAGFSKEDKGRLRQWLAAAGAG